VIQWVLAIWPLDPLPFLSPACTSRSTKFIYRWSLQKWDNQGARRVVRLPGTAEGHVPTSQAWQNVVHWRRGWKTTLVFLPWEFHERNEKNYHMTQQSHYWAHSHNWKHNWKRNMYPNIHCKTIYSSQDKEPRYSLIDEWIKKIWYIYAMEYFSAIKRNEIESVEVMQINIEHVIQNEGQKEKNEYCILRHIYIHTYMKSRKMVLMNLFSAHD